MTFPGREPKCRQFRRCSVEEALDAKTAPFLSASMIRAATAADSRARARNGSGRELAAPLSLFLYFRPRQIVPVNEDSLIMDLSD
ncbi:hypothetical protein ATANTOWER_010228 [Ataeniobius toweri]|uniref:Uncharacterized protein n=1 Tax=Ataeniobius toweri TaxID=208326 RepID=A0ABU7BVN1_9TELE|nr:hypothetical protein [Ataeniobius toweri]